MAMPATRGAIAAGKGGASMARCVVSWTALITSHAQSGHGRAAMECFRSMKRDNISPNAVTYASILRAVASTGDGEAGKEIHGEIVAAGEGMEGDDVVLGNALVNMYAKCGQMEEARWAFDAREGNRTQASWNALIAGYARHSSSDGEEEGLHCSKRMQQEEEALRRPRKMQKEEEGLHCLRKMHEEGEGLQWPRKMHDEEEGLHCLRKMHDEEEDVHCPRKMHDEEEGLHCPRKMHDEEEGLHCPRKVHDEEEALHCLRKMQEEGIPPNAVTFACIARCLSCAGRGEEMHAEMVKRGIWPPGNNLVLGNAVIGMYMRCGAIREARRAFDVLLLRDAVSWTSLIAGYSRFGHGEEALQCLHRMQAESISPDGMAMSCLVKTCGSVGALDKGKALHASIHASICASIHGAVELGNALVCMYAKCGQFAEAHRAIDRLHAQNRTNRSPLISSTPVTNPSPVISSTPVTDPSPVISSTPLTNPSPVISNTSVTNPSPAISSTSVTNPSPVISSTPVTNPSPMINSPGINRCRIAWNALIAAYCQSGRGEEAVSCFERMRGGSSPPPDAITFACIAKACGEIGASQKGAEIHAEVVKKGLSEGRNNSIIVGTALVDMYAKCGMLAAACRVFSRLRGHNVVSWTALISGYSRLGHTADALGLFCKMIEQGMAPNHITFVVVLGSCSSSGLAHEGETYFGYLTKTFGIAPRSEHYACMVSLFGRIGRFGKAVEAIHKLPSSQHLPAWYALLTACHKSGNLSLGKLTFQRMQREESPVR